MASLCVSAAAFGQSAWERIDLSQLDPSLFPAARTDGYKAIHLALLPSGNVIFWDYGTTNPDEASWSDDVYEIVNPSAPTRTLKHVPFMRDEANPENHRDVFCAGHHLLDDADGTLFVAGGHFGLNLGAKLLALYKHGGEGWIQPTYKETFQTMQRGRWYPQVVPVYPGRMMVFGGSTANSAFEFEPSNDFVYFGDNGRLHTSFLPWPTGFNMTVEGRYSTPVWIYYPWHFPFPQASRANELFLAGPMPASRIFDVSEQTWSKETWPTLDGSWTSEGYSFGYSYPCIAFIDGKVFAAGGYSEIGPERRSWSMIDLNDAEPRWRRSDGQHRMHVERKNHVATVLPNGKVLILGGSNNFNASYAPGFPENSPEIFDPELAYSGQNPFTLLDAPEERSTIARGYHSTAILLPSGKVLQAGGNNPTDSYDRVPENIGTPFDTEIMEMYTPHYIRDEAARPSIIAPRSRGATYRFGDSINVSVDLQNGATLKHFSIQSLGSVTHATNMGERFFKLELDANGKPVIPNKPWYIQSGWYMLFATDSRDSYSEGMIIRIEDPFSRVAPNAYRTFVGKREVQNESNEDGITELFMSDGAPRDFTAVSPAPWPGLTYSEDEEDNEQNRERRDRNRVVIRGTGPSSVTGGRQILNDPAVEFDTTGLPKFRDASFEVRVRIDASFSERGRQIAPEIYLFNYTRGRWDQFSVGDNTLPTKQVFTTDKDFIFEIVLEPGQSFESWADYESKGTVSTRIQWPRVAGPYVLRIDELMIRARKK